MKVFITGGSGLIGRGLAAQLLEAGHQPIILSRHANEVRRRREYRPCRVVQGDPGTAGDWQAEVDGCDVVVNLAGHNLFAERWNAEIKRKIRDSRVHGTDHVVEAIRIAKERPKALVQASAIGYYGPHGDEDLTESSPSGTDFLSVVCREWEHASEPVEELGVRRAIVRIGIVLAPSGGALAVMKPIFKLGPGAPIGSGGKLGPATGQQWMSWIHIEDIVGLFKLAIENDAAAGPINGTSPHPVRNAEFSKALSNALWKPYAFWRVYLPFGPPDAMLKLLLGDVAEVVASGQKVLPVRAQALGYTFKHPDLAEALRDVLARPKHVISTTAEHKPVPEASRSHAHH
ncbi:Epimerase family protein [Aquisphaera giovannonii]|uniref:Epimerase family protein n=1 Tax=Aquisphaera giovannonii TaxID=406548 RepID=A0A5B9VXI6_9BACT|nr:TIGR01777 family oxidoreductase [Aquisphaera giovannonii]QEH32988.1 Epimerase family protein [Aquisphaera giovannonii]